jgi:hypothetical protein
MLGHLRDVKIHILVALTTCSMLHESGTTALDLNTASGLLLDVLNISAAVTYNLSSKIETWKRFKVDWDLLFRPFTLSPG